MLPIRKTGHRHDLNLNARVPGSNIANNGILLYLSSLTLHNYFCIIWFIFIFDCLGSSWLHRPFWLRRAGAAPSWVCWFPWQCLCCTGSGACGLRVMVFPGSVRRGLGLSVAMELNCPEAWDFQIQDRTLRCLLRRIFNHWATKASDNYFFF